MTRNELKREFSVCKPFVACKTIRHFGFYQEKGICYWTKPDYRFHFFRILLEEERAYQKRARKGSLIGKKVICLN